MGRADHQQRGIERIAGP
jgi:hypothetical protein